MQNYENTFIFIIKNIQNKNSSLKIKLNQIENHFISAQFLYFNKKKNIKLNTNCYIFYMNFKIFSHSK